MMATTMSYFLFLLKTGMQLLFFVVLVVAGGLMVCLAITTELLEPKSKARSISCALKNQNVRAYSKSS